MVKIMLMTKMVLIVQLSKVATVDILHAISCYLHFKDIEFEGYRDQEYFSRAEIRKSRLKADKILLTRVWSLHHHNSFINLQ